MKTLIYSIIVIISIIGGLTSCNKETDTTPYLPELPASAPLGIKPLFQADIQTRATLSTFPDNAEIGLFVTSGDLGNPYNGTAANTNVKSKLSGGNWTQTPAVYLSPVPAKVYAYYPYNSANTDGMNIPIEHNTQVDYLFGTHTPGQSAICNSNQNVNLTMNHALALLQFRMAKANYTGAGTLTKIEVLNTTSTTVIYSEGKLNAQTGAIMKTTGKNQPAVLNTSYTIPATLPTAESQYPKLLILPVSAIQSGTVAIRFTIDGYTYTTNIAANTAWNSGTKNTYTVTLNGKDLTVGNVTITDWIDGVSGTATLQ